MTANAVRLKWLLTESDVRAGADADKLPLMSVSISSGVSRREVGDMPTRAASEDLSNYKLSGAGDLVINRMRAFQGALGIAPEDGFVSPDYAVLRINPSVEERWLNYYLTSEHTVSIMASMVRGIGGTDAGNVRTPRLNVSDLQSMTVPAISLDEQRSIANYLDRETTRIDTLIEKQQRLIETLRERRAGVIEHGLDSSAVPNLRALKYAIERVEQGVSPQAEAGMADEPGSWGVLKSGAVNRGVFRQDEHKRLPDGFGIDPNIVISVGDVIVSRASGSPDLVGSCGIVRRVDYQLILSDKLFRLRPIADVDPNFLRWLLNGQRYRTLVRQAISGAEGLANNLPLRALLSFVLPFPPLDEQRWIAAYLDEQTAKIDTLIAETERFIELSRERRAALITAAVTGQIDVGGEAA